MNCKILLTFVLIVGSAIAAPSLRGKQERNVADFLKELAKDFGLDKLLPWLQEQIRNDPDAQRIAEYLKGPKFQKIIDHLKGCPGYEEAKQALKDEGIDIIKIYNDIRDFLSGGATFSIKPRRTLGEILDEFLGKLDLQHIIEVIKEKKNDPNFKKIISWIKSDLFKGLHDCMQQSPEVQELNQKLKDEGVDLERIAAILKAIINAAEYKQGRNIHDLLESLIEEFGLKELLPWFREQIKNDPDVQRIVKYLLGPKFQKIIDHLKSCPGYQETKDQLLAEGVDLADLLQKFRDFLSGASTFGIKPRRTLGEILNELLGKLDLEHIIEVLKEKYENDPDMKKVVEFLKGDTFKGIVNCMKESPEVQELIQKLKDEGIDVERIIAMLKALLGASYSYKPHARNIHDLLESLIEELGLKELLPWLNEQIKNDPDVQRIVKYLQGPKFEKIIAHLKSCPGYQETKEQLLAEGVDLADIFQKFRDCLSGNCHFGIKPRRTLGELLDELIGKLDLVHIIEVIKDKCKNDPDMKKVVEFLKGDTFKGIVSCMKESPDVQELAKKLKDEGVDIERLSTMFEALLFQCH